MNSTSTISSDDESGEDLIIEMKNIKSMHYVNSYASFVLLKQWTVSCWRLKIPIEILVTEWHVTENCHVIVNMSLLKSRLDITVDSWSWILSETYVVLLIQQMVRSVKVTTQVTIEFPMDTSSSIRHRFDVEIPRGKFVEITSILKSESTWNLWHRFNVDISTWIRLSKSTKYRWVL